MADPEAADHTGLCTELRQLRLHGLHRARTLDLPCLLGAAGTLGHLDADPPRDLAVESLLRQAVDRLGESREATAAIRSFGLDPGQKLWKAADRRKSAARAQGVSVETFRKSYELTLIDQLANEIIVLLTLSSSNPSQPTPNPSQPTPNPRRSDSPNGAPAVESPEPPAPEPLVISEQQVADALRTAHASADWDLVEGAYGQCVAIAEDQARFMPESIPAFYAEALGRVSACYYGREELFILHGLGILANAEHANKITPALFQRLYGDDRFDRFVQYTLDGGQRRRRRPHPFETLVETARRFRDLNHLQAVLEDMPTSCVLGGSLNYGRYFSVRGGLGRHRGSNVDLMIVIPDYRWLDEVIAGVGELRGSARASMKALEQRAKVWRDHDLDDGYSLFSQRIQMWTDQDDPIMAWAPNRGEYSIDLRIVSSSVLDWILIADIPKLTANTAGNSRSIRDFCQHDTRGNEHQRSFSGRNQRPTLEVTELADSLLRTHRVYSIHDDRYYPGSVQNLLLPRFNARWDNVPVLSALEAFRWKIIERLRYERRQQPYELQRVSLSHTRLEGFAPHILRNIDNADAI